MTQSIEDNPFIKPQNYFEGYSDYLKKMKEQNKELGDLDELIFNVFNSNDGKKLIEIFKEKIIYPAVPGRIGADYDKYCIWMEGYKQAFRYLINMVNYYKERKDFEARQIKFKSEVKDV